MRPERWLVGCEFSGRVREALRRRGHDAWSCDILPAEDGSPYHIQGDVLDILNDGWDGAIFHPTCTRLTNSGSRWLHVPPPRRTLVSIWQEFFSSAEFYLKFRHAPIPKKAIENPVMHCHARELIGFPARRQVVQPYWFGDPSFKATGFELHNLPPLVPTNRLTPPKPGTPEHKAWSKVHRASPGPDRWKDRSRTPEPVADAMAEQWAGWAIQQEVA